MSGVNPLLYASKILYSTFGTVGGREHLYRMTENLFKIFREHVPSLYPKNGDRILANIDVVGEMIGMVWLLDFIPYFFKTKGEEAVKVKYNAAGLAFEDRSRVGKTAFKFHLESKPIKLITNLGFLLACVYYGGSLVARLLAPAFQIGNYPIFQNTFGKTLEKGWASLGPLGLSIGYGAKVIENIYNLATLDKDLSSSWEKETFNLSANALLFTYNFSKLFSSNAKLLVPIGYAAGTLGLFAHNYSGCRNLWKEQQHINFSGAV